MEFVFGLRIVDFGVWSSYLDVNFDYPKAVARLTVDRASACGTRTCVFQIKNLKDSLRGLQTSTLTNHVHFHLGCVLRMHVGALLPPAILPMNSLSELHPQYHWSCKPVTLVRIAIKMSQCGLLVLIIVNLLRFLYVC